MPEVLAAEEFDLVNGEKAADAGAKLGRVTTCAPNGEGNWEPEYTEFLTGKSVNIFVDNDDKGRQHGRLISRHLSGIANAVRVVELPGLPPKGDLYDWIEAGGTLEQLIQIVQDTPIVGETALIDHVFGPMTDDSSAPPDGPRVEEDAPSVFQKMAPYPAPLGEDAYYITASRDGSFAWWSRIRKQIRRSC